MSVTPDLINGLFECAGGLLVLLHCRAVMRDKAVAGVSVFATAVFTSWGFWNLYYYPSLGQWFSFAGGIVIVLANLLWLALLIRYSPPLFDGCRRRLYQILGERR